MEDFLDELEERAGRFEVLLADDIPSSVQQDLCGELAWDLKLEHAPLPEQGADGQPRKKRKSQRRKEKEQEYFERQKRMQENQKARVDALKKTPCRFHQQGKCKEGANCRFGHF